MLNYYSKIMEITRLPPGLRPQNTRASKDWHTSMMTRYNRMNEEYNNSDIFNPENNNHIENTDDTLKFEEADVFNFFKKAYSEMNKIKKNNNDIVLEIEKCEKFKNQISQFNELIKTANELYDNLSSDVQISDIKNKLIISTNILLQTENKINIEQFEIDIDEKIDNLNNKLSNNNIKLSDFKKLVLACMGDEKIDCNLCNICFTHKINICINPCGHTFCSSCIEKMGSKCGMCRGKIEAKIKMYIENDNNYDKKSVPSDGISHANLISDLNEGDSVVGWNVITSSASDFLFDDVVNYN
jgi:hypothetical protein